MIAYLPNKDKLLKNFSRCETWEEKYLYLIELGSYLPPVPLGLRTPENLIVGCQSQVWIVMVIDINGDLRFYGDSDASIVKGLIAMVFIFYQGLTPEEMLTQKVRPFFQELALAQYLTPSRFHGLEAIVRAIIEQASKLA